MKTLRVTFRTLCQGLLSALLLAQLTGAWAADKLVHASVTKTVNEPLGAANLLQLTFGLLVVLAAIVGSAWLLRRYGRLQSGAAGALRVIGGLSMGPRERVVLIQVGAQQLLLGVAPGSVQMLHVLAEPVPEISHPIGKSKFAEQLGKALGK